MRTAVVITPTFAGDFDLCVELNQSVLQHTDATHYLVVPRRDLPQFARLASTRCVVVCENDLLPSPMLSVPASVQRFCERLGLPRLAIVNPRRPYPPIRGWVLQQILKLAAAAQIAADVTLLVDSDVVFVRSTSSTMFVHDGSLRFYRKPGGVDWRLPRHVRWHQAARKMLGLPESPPPFPDYVSSLNVWDHRVVRALLKRIEDEAGRHWMHVVGAQLHFSEWTLYGTFVDEILGHPFNSYASDSMMCHDYWDDRPLALDAATDFVRSTPSDHIAIMISAKSQTPLSIRRAAIAGVHAPNAAVHRLQSQMKDGE